MRATCYSIVRAALAGALGALLSVAPGASLGAAIISEIMYDPAGPDRPEGMNKEWIELYNPGSTVLDLGGWSVGNPLNNQWAMPFPQNTLLFPHQALVVTGDAATFDAYWGLGINRVEVNNFPVLPNSPSLTSGAVAVRDTTATIRDSVNYQQANGWPRINGSHGASIFALPSGLSSSANDIGTNWAPSSWGAFGAAFSDHDGEFNHASPGYVETALQPPFAPSADAAWSMVLMPDTQNYVKWESEKHILTQTTEWIRDNRDAFNIQAVLHLGDIVNNNNAAVPNTGDRNSTQQWQSAQASMHVLNGHVPYVMAAGNHDYGFFNAENRDTQINTYFQPADNPLVDPAHGGILRGVMNEGEIQNAYYAFTAPDGRKLLLLALEWEPRPATVTWANQVVGQPEFADHTAVLITHAYLRGNNTRYTSSNVPEDHSGQELWAGLVRFHGNIEMVVNGHFGGDGQGYLASTALPGNEVHQLFFNTQFETQGGNGWIQLLEFLDDGSTVRVRTYSPYLNQTRTHADFAFEFDLSRILPRSFPGDFNGDGHVNMADYLVWRKMDGSAAEYQEWRANFGAQAPPSTLLAYNLMGIPNQPVPSAAATHVAEGILATDITRGPGVEAANLTNGFSARGWDRAEPSREAALASGDYFEFGVSVDDGFVVSLSSLDLSLRRSSVNSPRNLELQVSLDGFVTPGVVIAEFNYFGRTSGDPPAQDPLIADPFYYMHSDLPGRPGGAGDTTGAGDPIPTIDLSVFGELQNLPSGTEVTFRLYAWSHTTNTSDTNTLAFGRIDGPRLAGYVVASSSATVGHIAAPQHAAVPEPSCLLLSVFAAYCLAAGRSRRRLAAGRGATTRTR